MLLAFLVGTAKSLFLLDDSFRKSINRILNLKDGACLGAIYSWKLWGLVAIMMTMGFLLRTFTEPGRILGTLYVAVGWALCFSSRIGWSEWFQRN